MKSGSDCIFSTTACWSLCGPLQATWTFITECKALARFLSFFTIVLTTVFFKDHPDLFKDQPETNKTVVQIYTILTITMVGMMKYIYI